MAGARRDSRFREINRVRERLERHSYPRLQMFLLVSLTGAAGFLASFALLRAGLESMTLRYPAAICIAYVVFMGLLWVWLRYREEDFYSDAAEAALDTIDGTGSSDANCSGSSGGSSDSGVGDALGSLGDADDLAIPLALIIGLGAILVAGVVVMFSVVSAAPALFAELVVDGALSVSLYRRLQGLDRTHWIECALRRTIKPFLITAVLALAVGAGLGMYAPGAHSLGEAVKYSKTAPERSE